MTNFLLLVLVVIQLEAAEMSKSMRTVLVFICPVTMGILGMWAFLDWAFALIAEMKELVNLRRAQ